MSEQASLPEELGDGAFPSYAELLDAYADQRHLIEIGKDLIVERNRSRLLALILEASRHITGSDAGSIFLCETGERGPVLRFKHAVTRSLPGASYGEFTLPRDEHSIAGYVSLQGTVLNLPDVYALDPGLPYRFNPGYDLAMGYRTKSLLAVPMRNHTGEIVGVIQLINSKETPEAMEWEASTGIETADSILLSSPRDFDEKVVPYKRRYEGLMAAVANQAAIALENSEMIRRIEEQFDAFVRASVAAIESRDPATSGHSERVAALATALMRAVSAEREGRYASCSFGAAELLELEYAGLLHDYGKVYLDERVFTKAKKLHEGDYQRLVLRLKLLIRSVELTEARRSLTALELGRREERVAAERESAERVQALLEALEYLPSLIEPEEREMDPKLERLLAAAPPPELVPDLDGSPLPFLTEEERRNLTIRRGTLNEAEYEHIRRHVEFTSSFVSRIPWPRELAGIPEFCGKHHEMLDGSGYPGRLKADQIPLQARMLAVADVYDALSARDRPYKKALPFETVCHILRDEADRGRLDEELVRIFLEAECWKATSEGTAR